MSQSIHLVVFTPVIVVGRHLPPNSTSKDTLICTVVHLRKLEYLYKVLHLLVNRQESIAKKEKQNLLHRFPKSQFMELYVLLLAQIPRKYAFHHYLAALRRVKKLDRVRRGFLLRPGYPTQIISAHKLTQKVMFKRS